MGWSKEYSFLDREVLSKIVPAPASPSSPLGEYYVLGMIRDNADDDQLFLKINENGDEIFRKELDFNDDQLRSGILLLENGNYLFFGSWGGGGQIGIANQDITAAAYLEITPGLSLIHI